MLPVRRFSPTLFDLLAPSDQAGPCPLSGLSIDVWRGWDSSHSEQPLSSASALPPLRLAVVGHVEWVEFLAVDQLPRPGAIGHALRSLQEPAGGGAVVAVQMARLQQQPVQFFTALGRDSVGEACVKRLQDLGLEVHVAWREAPTRRGVSMVDAEGDRAITVIG